jgi:hypothetical protein
MGGRSYRQHWEDIIQFASFRSKSQNGCGLSPAKRNEKYKDKRMGQQQACIRKQNAGWPPKEQESRGLSLSAGIIFNLLCSLYIFNQAIKNILCFFFRLTIQISFWIL